VNAARFLHYEPDSLQTDRDRRGHGLKAFTYFGV
jgi:hypothetical protein